MKAEEKLTMNVLKIIIISHGAKKVLVGRTVERAVKTTQQVQSPSNAYKRFRFYEVNLGTLKIGYHGLKIQLHS